MTAKINRDSKPNGGLSARAAALIADAQARDSRNEHLADAAARPADGADFHKLVLEQHNREDGKVAAPPAGQVSPAPAASTSLTAAPAPSLPPVSLTPVGRSGYTPHAMVALMIEHPEYTHAMLCAHFGRPPSWLPTVLASDAFQRAVEPHRHLIADPALTATLKERYSALAIRTSNVMMDKLDSPDATDFMVLKAGEIAMKALGMGQKQVEAPPAPAAPAPQQESLAERLMRMMDEREQKRTVDVEAEDVTPDGNV